MELGLKEHAAGAYETALPLMQASFGLVHQKSVALALDAAACFVACGRTERAGAVLGATLDAVELELGSSHVWARKLRSELEEIE